MNRFISFLAINPVNVLFFFGLLFLSWNILIKIDRNLNSRHFNISQKDSTMKPDLWIDGEFIHWNNAHFHPLSHSLQRGATLFESIDCAESVSGLPVIFRLYDHMARFEESARLIGMPLKYSLEEL